MHYILETIYKILSHNVLVHVYSSPSFVMEIGVTIMMIIVHWLLVVEITDLIKQLNMPPLKLRSKRSANEFTVLRRPVIRKHPELGVDVIFKENAVLSNEWDTITKINTILSTSLSEFIHGDSKREQDENNIITSKLESGKHTPLQRIYEHPRYENKRAKID